MLFQFDELIDAHFRVLHKKKLFPLEDLSDIEKRLKYPIEFLEEKAKEIQNIKEEFYSMPGNKNPYVEYGFKINLFSITVPLERPSMIVNRHKPKKIAEEFIEGVLMGSDSNLLLIVGDQGVGKSHFLNYFSNQINNLSYGKALAIKIQCKSNQDMLDLYPKITESLKRLLLEKNESELVNEISRILADRGTPRLVQDLMKILKEIQMLLASRGYANSFILIDELENTLPPIQEHELHLNGDLDQRRTTKSMGTPQSISQLSSLTRLSAVGFILNLRKYDWNLWQNEIMERVSTVENRYIIDMESLSLQDSKQFLTHRIEANEFRTSSKKLEKELSLRDDAIN